MHILFMFCLLFIPFFCLPPHLSFLSLDKNTCKLNISVIGASVLKLSPTASTSGSLLWLSKLLPALKAKQPCYCCVPQKKQHLWRWIHDVAKLRWLSYSVLCLVLMLTVMLLVFGSTSQSAVGTMETKANLFNMHYICKSPWLTFENKCTFT